VTATKLIRQLVLGAAIGLILWSVGTALGWWHASSSVSRARDYFDYDVEWNRVLPSLVLWLVFSGYWSIAGRNAAPAATSESRASTVVHQVLLNGSLILLFWEAPGLSGWFLPRRWHFLVPVGVIVQVGFMLLAVWARRHLGRNWSAEVRGASDHQLVRTGPYRLLRHPIYTAMLGMFLGTAIASSQYHALLGLAILFVAYLRKTRLEEQILGAAFGAEYGGYRRDTWALVPLVF
jgi:protein-S-isoprenylcysteine O-methyltransferase Ste14